MGLINIDFSSTVARRAATSLGIVSLLTLVALAALACHKGDPFKSASELLKGGGVAHLTLLAGGFLGGYLFSYTFFSQNSQNKHDLETGRPKKAVITLILVVVVIVAVLAIVAKSQGANFVDLLKKRETHLTLSAIVGLVTGGSLGFLISRYKTPFHEFSDSQPFEGSNPLSQQVTDAEGIDGASASEAVIKVGQTGRKSYFNATLIAARGRVGDTTGEASDSEEED